MGTGAPLQSAVLLTHVKRAQHPHQGTVYNQKEPACIQSAADVYTLQQTP